MTTPARNVHAYQDAPWQFYQKNTCSGGESLFNSGISHWKELHDVRPASVSNPKSRTGWRNPSAWSKDYLAATPTPNGSMLQQDWCTNRYQWTGNRYIGYPGIYATDAGMLSYLVAPPSWVSNLANTRAYLALKNQNANLSEAFFTRSEAKRMFKNAAEDIAKQVTNFRFRHPRDWGNVVKNGILHQWKDIPNRWLELQYGWIPLMSDIYGTLGVLDRDRSDNKAYMARVKGSAKSVTHQRVQIATSPYFWLEDVERTFHVKTVLYYRLQSPVLASLASLGLTNPLELGWELVKYSFVVDWFLPVGNWLSTLDADFGWLYETGCQSISTNVKVDSKPYNAPRSDGHLYQNFTDGPKGKGIRFRRVTLDQPPGVGLPHFKNPLSAQHIANAMSLLSQAFRK